MTIAVNDNARAESQRRKRKAKTLKLDPGLIDRQSVRNMIGAVPEEKQMRRASRYDVLIATIVGFLALCVSGYTAYMQRQQVRAAVWPILEFDTSNGPDIHFTVANKGVGPAIIRHVVVRVDDQPVRNWLEALDKFLGPGPHRYSESDITGHVFAANESMDVFTPRDDDGNLLNDRTKPLWVEMNKDRARVSVEICYSSTLGECWTLRSTGGGSTTGTTIQTSHCPTPSAITFQQ
jgi:hypothetical protein